MNELSKYGGDDRIKVYEGIPNSCAVKEISSWRKFLKFITPWLNKKYELGERYLEAKVLHEEAQAVKTFAEAQVQYETAKKIAREATAQEQEKMTAFGTDKFSHEDIQLKMAEFEEKLKNLSMMYGTKVAIEVKQNIPTDALESEGSDAEKS